MGPVFGCVPQLQQTNKIIHKAFTEGNDNLAISAMIIPRQYEEVKLFPLMGRILSTLVIWRRTDILVSY